MSDKRNFYAAQSPRGFSNEVVVHVFSTRAGRDAWVAENDDDRDGAERCPWAITAKAARRILGDRGDGVTQSYNNLVTHETAPSPLVTEAEILRASEWTAYCVNIFNDGSYEKAIAKKAGMSRVCAEAERLLAGVKVSLDDLDEDRLEFDIDIPVLDHLVCLSETADQKTGWVAKPSLRNQDRAQTLLEYAKLFRGLKLSEADEALKIAVLVGILVACDKLLPPRLFRLWWTSEDGQGCMQMSRHVAEDGVDDAIAADLDELLDVQTSEEGADEIRAGTIDVAFDCYDLKGTPFDTLAKAA